MHPHIGPTSRRHSNLVRATSLELAASQPVQEPPRVDVIEIAENPDVQATRDLLVTLARQVGELQNRRRQTLSDIASLSVELGVAVAEKLLCAEIAANRQRLDRIVQYALARLPSARAVTLRAHPDDIALLQQQLASDAGAEDVREKLSFEADVRIPRGQLKLEAGEFFVEWDTATSLAALHSAVLAETLVDG